MKLWGKLLLLLNTISDGIKMYINEKIAKSLDNSDASRFIKFVYKAVTLFDKNVDEKLDFHVKYVISLSSPVHDDWHSPEYYIPIFRLLHIEEENDTWVVIHYAKSKSFYPDKEDPYSGSLISFDYILYFSYAIASYTTVLNDNFHHLYEILTTNKLLSPIENELERLIILNS